MSRNQCAGCPALYATGTPGNDPDDGEYNMQIQHINMEHRPTGDHARGMVRIAQEPTPRGPGLVDSSPSCLFTPASCCVLCSSALCDCFFGVGFGGRILLGALGLRFVEVLCSAAPFLRIAGRGNRLFIYFFNFFNNVGSSAGHA